MKTTKINTEIIKALNPCKDRFNNWLKEYDKEVTLQEFIKLDKITYSDKIWVLTSIAKRFTLEVFAIDAALRVAEYAADATDDAYAAYAADAAVDAAYAADAYAAYAADVAVDAAYAADAREQERQISLEILVYLIETEEDGE